MTRMGDIRRFSHTPGVHARWNGRERSTHAGGKELESSNEPERIANDGLPSLVVAGDVTARQEHGRTTNTRATIHGKTVDVEHEGTRSRENVRRRKRCPTFTGKRWTFRLPAFSCLCDERSVCCTEKAHAAARRIGARPPTVSNRSRSFSR